MSPPKRTIATFDQRRVFAQPEFRPWLYDGVIPGPERRVGKLDLRRARRQIEAAIRAKVEKEARRAELALGEVCRRQGIAAVLDWRPGLPDITDEVLDLYRSGDSFARTSPPANAPVGYYDSKLVKVDATLAARIAARDQLQLVLPKDEVLWGGRDVTLEVQSGLAD